MPDAAGQLQALYAEWSEPCTINGSATRCIPSDGFIDPGGLAVSSTQPTARVIASENPAVALGQALVRAGVTYLIFDVQPIAPDKLETRLILERQ